MVAVLPSRLRRSGAGKRDRQNARRFSGGHFAVLGMVGIYKKEIGFRGGRTASAVRYEYEKAFIISSNT